MGFFARKSNFAKKFKKAYEKNDEKEMYDVLNGWLDDKPDANSAFATVILFSLIKKAHINELKEMFNTASSLEAEDSKLLPWFKDTAEKELSDYENEYSGKVFDELTNNKFLHLNCRQFSFKCVEFIKVLRNQHISHDGIIGDFNELLRAWALKFPEDVNRTCVFIMYSNLSEDELLYLLRRMTTQKTCDEKVFKFLSLLLNSDLSFRDYSSPIIWNEVSNLMSKIDENNITENSKNRVSDLDSLTEHVKVFEDLSNGILPEDLERYINSMD
ncbi:hypothetical protein [Methanobrevibacter sp.]|uniref:hypothetical protein n=1 Tax=Methanobrevibacter sp. TaxID=66852 RepID=UPI00386CE419